MRYRVIFETTPSGGFCEFSADNDEAALTEARQMSAISGRVIVLSAVDTGRRTARDVIKECRHCGRSIVLDGDRWVDPEATGDDSVWRETCDAHDTFVAEHEPTREES
jgi:hypothetical protein